ncbi:glycosyltransferase [Candidatus Berkiella cookevillensis]|uniref:Glycosyltransferase n=1 Tax=Candidatus Berkiella cookevillensis TaxID=437022 RepID=A0A0Q9YBC7_9GAMM|nr:glycosyltransferase [Candidatus Berkiella cookevillensis]MCS5709131.1 glycosyltransferase [Candidatus Berkiella cookevillensis]
MTKRVKILHIIYQLSVGGLENGLVNLINSLPEDKYEHHILSLTTASHFKERIKSCNCIVSCLDKKIGPLFWYYAKIFHIIKQYQPDIVHTRNLASIECQFLAFLASVPVRLHGEHGRDTTDLKGENKKNLRLKALLKPFIHKFIPLSKELESKLIENASVAQDKIIQIYNGVNINRFQNRYKRIKNYVEEPFVIVTVGRLQAVKNFEILIKAFSRLQLEMQTELKLWIVGDGPLKESLVALCQELTIEKNVIFWGERQDIPELLQEADLFVLPSLVEGVSNTILEAMGCGLAIIASEVGGNPELIQQDYNGQLFDPHNAIQLKDIIKDYVVNQSMRIQQGENSRKRVEQCFSLELMVEQYHNLYSLRF